MLGRGNVSLEGCTDNLVLASYPDCCRSIMCRCNPVKRNSGNKLLCWMVVSTSDLIIPLFRWNSGIVEDGSQSSCWWVHDLGFQ